MQREKSDAVGRSRDESVLSNGQGSSVLAAAGMFPTMAICGFLLRRFQDVLFDRYRS